MSPGGGIRESGYSTFFRRSAKVRGFHKDTAIFCPLSTVSRSPLLLLSFLLLLLISGPAEAQFYHFGKNKVQFADFRWQKMETPHFDVYFFAEEEELAGYAAHMAEQGYADLERKFGHTVQRRIPLIVYSSHIYFEQTNVIPNLLPEGVGGFTEFLKGRVALPLSGSLPEFERVLHHELVHVFTFDRIRQIQRRYGVTDYRPPPLWFSEGLAEYWSGEWSNFGDMVIRDALFARRLASIAQMYYINGTFQMYKEGESICHFMADKYGEDVFELLFENWWRGEDFADLFEIVTGDELEELDKDWQYHLEKRYLPDIARGDPPSQMARRLTEVGFNVKPELLPTEGDSTLFVFFRNHQGYTHIAQASLEGGEPEVVVEGERSPDIESLHPLGTRPAVSGDGRWLAFAAKHRGRDHLYVWDLEEGKEAKDLAFDEVVAIASPSWSPDGKALVFSGAGLGGITDLYRVEVESGSLRALTRDIYHDRDPAWSPDGKRIAFSSDRWIGGREGRYNLFLYELEGERILTLTRGEQDDQQPAWSPEGEWLAFSSDRDTMFDLYAVRLEVDAERGLKRGEEKRLTRVLTGAFDPAWLPGEQGLLFSGFEEGGFHIYRLEVADSLLVGDAEAELEPFAEEPWRLEGLHASSQFARRTYEKKMSLDIAQSQISQDPEFGTSGGIQVALSDVLGNDQYYFVLSHIAGSETGFFDGMNATVARLHQGQRLNVLWGFFRLNDRFTSTFGRFVREKRTGGFAELSYPFSLHDRVETRLSLRHSDIDRELGGQILNGWLATNFLSYTHDSSLWIPTGPLEGKRYSMGIGQTVDFKSSRRYNVTLFGDYRQYFRLSRRSALAMRFMGRHSYGDVPEYFSMGGSWTLRGYPWRSIWGRKMVLMNQELRFPLLDRLVIGFPFGNIDFQAFRGALFVDAGNAWNDEFGDWHGSIGGGTRLALGGVFVFRLDWARRTDFKSVGNDTHWDFFFGWDF